MLFKNHKKEVPLEKLTKNRIHSGIVVDFFIESINTVIEVHGIQHYKSSSFGRDAVDTMISYTRQLDRDSKLKNICSMYGINLIEIPYDMSYSSILSLLTEVKIENSGN